MPRNGQARSKIKYNDCFIKLDFSYSGLVWSAKIQNENKFPNEKLQCPNDFSQKIITVLILKMNVVRYFPNLLIA